MRVALLVSALLAAAVAGLTGILLWSQGRALAGEMRDARTKAAGALAEVCRDAAVNQQLFPLANYLKKLKSSPEILEAFCADERGEVLGHTDVARTGGRLEAGELARLMALEGESLSESGGRLEADAPARLQDRTLGVARVVFSKEAVEARFRESLAAARGRILKASVPVLLAAFAGAFLVTGLALRPLGELVEGVRVIARGKWDHRVKLGTRDELAWLGDEFNQMAEKLGELDAMKRDFVSSVTHDLKSPIASVKIAVEVAQAETESLLKGAAAPQRLGESFLHIRERLERLTHLITSLLDVARIESLTALDKSPVDLEEVVAASVRSFEMIARQKGLSLDLAVENKVRRFPGDAGKLERAVSNLVGNAVKFTSAGRVLVTVAERNGRAEVSVQDSGPGIPPEAMEKLFSKFFRVAAGGPKQPLEGTGLGLAIAKGFAEAHGGTVSVESRPGQGATFRISIPL